MAKKKKKSRRNRGKSKISQIKDLPAVGENYLANGQYAEAIKIYRRLARDTDSDQWDAWLLRAFRGRIDQLTARGMAKEGLLIYQNMVALFPDRKNDGQHIHLLLKAGRLRQVSQLYGNAGLTGTDKQVIDELIAALLLSGQEDMLEQLPEDAPLRVQFQTAQDALRRYCEKEDAAALALLQKIPFRSPYKNFRLALNGMILFHTSADEAQPFFSRVDEQSPFFRLIVPYLHLSKKQHITALQGIEKKMVQVLEGLESKKRKFIMSLPGHDKSPHGLLLYLLSAGSCLPPAQHRNLCHRFLPHVPECLKNFQRKFDPITDEFELLRIEALALEIEEAYPYAVKIWSAACDLLVKRNNPADNLKIAMIYRHIAQIMRMVDQDYDYMEINIDFDKNQQREMLVRSLQYEPDDLETWIKIHSLLLFSRAEQYRWLNTMLDTFPDEPEVLLLGVEATIARHAFKKASKLAARLLAIDPINTQVRTLLIDAHLNHALKLAGRKKYALAVRECEQAETYNRNNLARGRIAIRQGMIEILQGNDEQGAALIAAGEQQQVNPVLACLHTRMEAEQCAISEQWKRKLDRAVRTILQKKPEKAHLLEVVQEYMETVATIALPAKFRAALIPWLKKGIRLKMDSEDFQNICRFLWRIKELKLLELYGKKGVARWPEIPIFHYYRVYGKTRAGEKRVEQAEYQLLEDLWDKAVVNDDTETEYLIDEFLEQSGYWDECEDSFSELNDGVLPDWENNLPDGDKDDLLAKIDRLLLDYLKQQIQLGNITNKNDIRKNIEELIKASDNEPDSEKEKICRDFILKKLQEDQDNNTPVQLDLFP
jgi:tetratricopeptide (TPR) repeat protein